MTQARTTGASTTSTALSSDHWGVDDVLRQEPDLELVTPDDVAHDEIICPIVARLRRAARHRSCLFEHDFVSMEESRDLCRRFLAALGWPGNQGRLGDVRCHRNAH